MDNITSYARNYALKLGIPPCLTGFRMFTQAVVAYATAPGTPTLEEVCKEIADRESLQPNTVEHSIAYALKATPDLGKKLFEVLGAKVEENDVHPKLVICLVAQNVKRDLEELA